MTGDERDRAERACERLVREYAQKADFGFYEKASELYVVDGELEIAGQTHVGRAAIRDRAAGKGAADVSRHVCSGTVIDVLAPDSARGKTYVTLYRSEARESGPAEMRLPHLVGHYDDEFVLNHEGWRFRRRKLVTTFRRP